MVSENLVRNKGAIAQIIIALAGITFVWMSSFRLAFGNIELAWHVNSERIALAAAVGVAFASAGAVIGETRSHLKFHTLGFATVSFVSTVLLMGALWNWPLGLAIPAAGLTAAVIWFLVSYALSYRASMNLWSAVILGISFGLNVINFLIASSVGGIFGKLVYWLQGSLFEVSGYGFLALLLSLVLFAWLLAAKVKEAPATLLLGLGIGIAGPVFFVACLVPMTVRRLAGLAEEKLFLITCGAVGALFIVLADFVPRLLIGGYSPSLLIPVSLVSIPVFLYHQRAMLSADFPSRIRETAEAGIIIVWLISFALVLYHVVQFAVLAA